jgi:hypothetical protein
MAEFKVDNKYLSVSTRGQVISTPVFFCLFGLRSYLTLFMLVKVVLKYMTILIFLLPDQARRGHLVFGVTISISSHSLIFSETGFRSLGFKSAS